MKKQDFISNRLERWNRLTKLLARLETSGASKMEDHELDEFVHLYRIACSDLARARSEELGDDVEDYLNVLVARAHKQFHPPKPPQMRTVRRFFKRDFPRAVRAKKGYVFAAAALFSVPILLTTLAVIENPARAYLLTDPEQLEALTDAYATGHQGGRSEDQDSLMAGYYVNNNIGVAFRCFATGIFFGIGSAFFLVINGILGGAVGAYICLSGYSESFLSFVIGHGAFELTAIVLSGAIGLEMGMLLVNPGQRTRLEALKRFGPHMITVILGAAAMLVIAAFIEGFWSPSSAPASVKFTVGAFLWALVIAYLSLAGRAEETSARKEDT